MRQPQGEGRVQDVTKTIAHTPLAVDCCGTVVQQIDNNPQESDDKSNKWRSDGENGGSKIPTFLEECLKENRQCCL